MRLLLFTTLLLSSCAQVGTTTYHYRDYSAFSAAVAHCTEVANVAYPTTSSSPQSQYDAYNSFFHDCMAGYMQ